MVYLRSRQRRR